jgi:hypothetical protein
MSVHDILPRLQKVKSTGPDRWIACCPAHQDRSPSLTIRALADGRVLMHCFSGCEVDDVLGAVGLSFGDLFPEPLTREFLPKIHAPFSALEALQCLTAESAIVAIASSDVADGKPLSPTDANRVAVAAGRIASALEAVHGR